MSTLSSVQYEDLKRRSERVRESLKSTLDLVDLFMKPCSSISTYSDLNDKP